MKDFILCYVDTIANIKWNLLKFAFGYKSTVFWGEKKELENKFFSHRFKAMHTCSHTHDLLVTCSMERWKCRFQILIECLISL